MEDLISSGSSAAVNSWVFFFATVFAVIGCQFFRSAIIRKYILLTVSLVCLIYFISDFANTVALGVFLAATYAISHFRARLGDGASGLLIASVVIFYWVFLFAIKGGTLFGPLNPFFHFPIQIIGVSYITFRAIGYFVDADQFDDRSVTSFLLYMLFFPTLLAGPIERYDDFESNISGRAVGVIDSLGALHRIANGAIMKFVLADNLAPLGIFQTGDQLEVMAPGIIALGVLLQLTIIFLDFAGYTSMMIGIAALCGYKLSENFNQFWLARNVQEFWQRWHITMTSFIRDFIFTPIYRWAVMNIRGGGLWPFTIGLNFATIMLIALWHAPTWGYFAFGIAHGLAITVTQISMRVVPPLKPGAVAIIGNNLGRVVNYVFVSLTMLLWYYGWDHSLEILGHVFTGASR